MFGFFGHMFLVIFGLLLDNTHTYIYLYEHIYLNGNKCPVYSNADVILKRIYLSMW